MDKFKKYETPITKYEKLTIRTISNALDLADRHDLDESVKKNSLNFLSTLNFYRLEIDKNFSLTVQTSNNPNDVSSFQVFLKDGDFELIPYAFTEGINLYEPDKEIIWEKDGPWVRIIEKRIKAIYDAYELKIEKEERKKQRTLEYFTKMFRDAPKMDLDVNYSRMIKTLKDAAEVGLVNHKTKNVSIGMGSLAALTIHTFTFGVLKITTYNHRKGYLRIDLYDAGLELSISNGYLDDETINFSEVYWKSVFLHELMKLKKQIEQKKQEKIIEAADYFRNKYKEQII